MTEIARGELTEQELNRRTGVAEAEVTSARELNTEERRVLESQIERMTGKTVVARYAQDRSLLGGAVVRMGSTIESNVDDVYTYYDIEEVKKIQYDLAKSEYGPLVKAVEVERMQGE